MSAIPVVEAVLGPADLVRRRALRGLGAFARPLMTDRDLRVAIMGAIVVSTALLSTLVAPIWMLALGPIVFGVPHLLADLRYLWIRPGYSRRPILWLAVVPALLWGAATGRVVAGLAAAIGALVVARAPARRRIIGLVVGAALLVGALRLGRFADVLFVHAHNIIAVVLWWMWRPRTSRLHWVPLVLFAAFTALLFSGAAEPVLRGTLGLRGPALGHHLRLLAPGAGPELGVRIVLSFCFAQSVHYGVWLRLVPEEDRPRVTPRTFVASFHALRADVGTRTLVIFGVGALALAVWAAVDLVGARLGYLRFAAFHGQLEVAALALLWAEGAAYVQLSRWAAAFVLTQVIETPIWTYALRERFQRTSTRVLAGLGASTITHPVVWFVIPYIVAHPYRRYLITAETFAFVTEALYVCLLGLRIDRAFFWSLVANGASFTCGVLCQAWFHFP